MFCIKGKKMGRTHRRKHADAILAVFIGICMTGQTAYAANNMDVTDVISNTTVETETDGKESTEYTGSYGDQLCSFSLYAPDIYEILVETFVENRDTVTEDSYAVYTLPEPISFAGSVSESDGEEEVIKDGLYMEVKKPLTEAVSAAWPAFLYDHPEVFWLARLDYSYLFDIGEIHEDGTAEIKITGIKLTPVTDYGTETAEAIRIFRENTESAAETIRAETEGQGLYAQVKAVHDYVCENGSYDEDSEVISTSAATDAQLRMHGAGPVFVQQDGNGIGCEGYAKAVKVLCDKLGIPCACVVGEAHLITDSDTDTHMWDLVQMEDGKWYLVDATWDDTGREPADTYLLVGSDTIGENIAISEERTVSEYIYSLPDGYELMEFAYPELEDTAYRRGTK